MLSLYQQHVKDWTGCTKCYLHLVRNKMVFAKGKLPCDVLFIGEAPGESENVVGIPFVGPAGKLLDKIIHNAGGDNFSKAFTNLVACIPLDGSNNKLSEPAMEDVRACSPRLNELYDMATPKLVVCVGTLAKEYLDKLIPHRQAKSCSIVHPAAIIRAMVAQQGYMIQKAVISLREALEELC